MNIIIAGVYYHLNTTDSPSQFNIAATVEDVNSVFKKKLVDNDF